MSGLFAIPGIGEVTVGVTTRYGSKPHFHEGYSVGIFHGRARIWCRDQLREVGEQDVVVLEPLEVHGGRGDANDCPQDGLVIEPALVEGLFGVRQPVRFVSPVIADAALARRWKQAMRSRTAADLRGAVESLFTSHGIASPEECKLEAVARPATFDAAASIASCAESARLSRSHYSRQMRKQLGLSPRDYRRLRRVHAARRLIEAGMSLADCAVAAGFADQAHMTRQMKSILGVTPGALRST